MELITLNDATRMTPYSYSYLFAHKQEYGFFQPRGKGKWLAFKKEFEEKFKSHHNANRLTSEVKEAKKCQLKNAAMSGILTSPRQMEKELGDLLARRTKSKR